MFSLNNMLVIAPTTFICGFLIILPFFLRNKTVTTSSGQTSQFAAMQLYASQYSLNWLPYIISKKISTAPIQG